VRHLSIILLLSAPLLAEESLTTESGLRYEILQKGEAGTNPKSGEKVSVHYTGWLEDGKKFDSSVDRGKPFTFTVGQGVIQGWSEALPLMTVGARYKFTIPWKLAYGERGSPPTIPAKANLIFEIELLSVIRPPVFTKPDPAKQTKTESGLKYEVLAEGEGDGPALTDGVKLKFALWNDQGQPIVSTAMNGQHLGGLCGLLRLTRAGEKFLAEAVQLMKPGARYRFEVPPELCWGGQAIHPALPANSTSIWEMELVEVNKVPAFTKPDPTKQTKRESGLAYEVLKEGTGKMPQRTDTVTVHYTGWLTDGTAFDSSYARGEPATFPLGQVIRGWTEGLQLMKEGAKFRFVIPAAIGYGDRGSPPTIPPGATLVFEVELIKIGK